MPHDQTHFPIAISLREVAAAWACCGLVALGALLVQAVDRRDDLPVSAFVGVHIPSAGEMSVRNVRFEEVPDDASEEKLRTYSNREEAPVCTAQETDTDLRRQSMPSAVSRARSIC
jgi:hypothetical protein